MSEPNQPMPLPHRLRHTIRLVTDFPQPGGTYRDISTLLADIDLLRETIEAMTAPYRDERIDKVTMIESRGFVFGTSIALELNVPLVMIRRPGKLPVATWSEKYGSGLQTTALELAQDAIAPGERVLIVDDVLASGGAMSATIRLVERAGGEVAGITLLAEIPMLNGRDKLPDVRIERVLEFRRNHE